MVERQSDIALEPMRNQDQYKQPHSISIQSDHSQSTLHGDYRSLPDHDGGAEKLKKSTSSSVWAIILDVLLALVTLCFLVLAGIAAWLKGRPTGSTIGVRVEEAMKLGPTIYPIIFAALLSRSLKSIGRYRAQNGTKLMTLYTLMNTNSVSDPVAHVFNIPKSILVWCLLPIWALSPLGGQGSLRLMYHTNSTTITTDGLRYLDSGPLGNNWAYTWIWMENDGSYPLSMRDIYIASLMQGTTTKTGPLDQWGNVKIPRLPDANTANADSDGWYPAPTNASEPEAFTSLLGIPIVGLSEINAAKVNFTVETTYVELSCPKMEFTPPSNNGTDNTGLGVAWDGYSLNSGNYLVRYPRVNAFLGPPAPQLTAAEEGNATFTEAQKIRFNSTTLRGTSKVACPVTQRHVETFIECKDGDCAATKIRPSKTDHRSANYTSFEYWGSVALDMISRASQQDASANIQLVGPSTSELFLNDTNTLPLTTTRILYSQGEDGSVNLSSVRPDLFSVRASVLLNTALQVFMAPTGFAGNISSNMTVYGPNYIPIDGYRIFENASTISDSAALNGGSNGFDENAPFMAASTNATITRHTEVYHPNYAWVTILVISAVLLFCIAVFSLCLRCATRPPNVFDPVMGLTYNNKDMPISAQHAPLDADERVRMISHERVRLGYVKDNGMSARLAFGEEASINPLRKARW